MPIEGSFKNTRIDNVEAIWEVLRNAFIEALMPSVDNEIDISSAADVGAEKKEGFFKRLFSSKKEKR